MRYRTSILLVAALALTSLPVYGQGPADVVISEIMQNPAAVADSEGEYIELYNPSSSSISMAGWTLTVDAESDELDGGTIPPGGFALLCIDGQSSENGGIEHCTVDYPDRITLKNSGSTIILEDAEGSDVDRVSYDGGSVWPDPNGASLEYIGPPEGNTNAAMNWQLATRRRGDFAGMGGDLGSPNANSSGGQLPVELAGFHVTAESRRVTLTWTTASESNNAGFLVQHRRPRTEVWHRVRVLDGQGTSSRSSRYRCSANVEAPGTHTFRLVQIDTDGTHSILAREAVKISAASVMSLSGPNPVRQGTVLPVVLSGREAGPVRRLGLYNVLGQRVRTLISSSVEETRTVDVQTGNLPSGTYFLRARWGAREEVERFTVVQ